MSNDSYVERSGLTARYPGRGANQLYFEARRKKLSIQFKIPAPNGMTWLEAYVGPGDFEELLSRMIEANKDVALAAMSRQVALSLEFPKRDAIEDKKAA